MAEVLLMRTREPSENAQKAPSSKSSKKERARTIQLRRFWQNRLESSHSLHMRRSASHERLPSGVGWVVIFAVAFCDL